MKGTIAFILGLIITIGMIWYSHGGSTMDAKVGGGIGFALFVVLSLILLVKHFLEKE